MIDKKTFKKNITTSFDKDGFKKKGQSWYLEGKDAIVVTNLQKSDWDELYYINIGIWLKALGDASFPQENQWHLSYRAESLFPEQREIIIRGCSLIDSTPQMLNDLSEFIVNSLIPFLRECTEEKNLINFFSQGILNNGLVMKEARLFLTKRIVGT